MVNRKGKNPLGEIYDGFAFINDVKCLSDCFLHSRAIGCQLLGIEDFSYLVLHADKEVGPLLRDCFYAMEMCFELRLEGFLLKLAVFFKLAADPVAVFQRKVNSLGLRVAGGHGNPYFV